MLFAACEGVDPALYQQSRGWSPDDWAAAVDRLATRGLLIAGGAPTPDRAGAALRVEGRTDELAVTPYAALGDDGLARLLDVIGPAADRIAAAGEIIFPNPMGLPASTGSDRSGQM